MRAVVISDTHDNTPNFRKAVAWAEEKGVEWLFHCGDVSRISTWQEVMRGFSGDFRLSLGNADEGFSWQKKKDEVGFKGKVSSLVRTEIDGCRVCLTHFPQKAEAEAERGSCDFVFYGHTHKPWIEKRGGVFLVNPGNLAGIKYPPTFCYISPEKGVELKRLDSI